MKDQEDRTNQAAKSLFMLREMIRALPEPVQTSMHEQLEEFMDGITTQEFDFHHKLSQELHDIQILVTAMQFDLESTKRERDQYKAMLGE
jgi:hypothetical protein